jgi:hypothetical protein
MNEYTNERHLSQDRVMAVHIGSEGNGWKVWSLRVGSGNGPVAMRSFETETGARAYANDLWKLGALAASDTAPVTYHNAMRAASYGVQETNPLPDGGHDFANFEEDGMSLSQLAAAGGRVTRLRLLTENGYPYMDISYCHGTLPNGRNVHIDGAPSSLRKAKGSVPVLRDLVEWAKEEGVHGKRIGLLDEGNWSILKG